MQKLPNGTIIFSASDMTAAADCEWTLVRNLDKKLGHKITVPKKDDDMLKRAGDLGNIHEEKKLESLRTHPGDVVEIVRPDYKEGQEVWLRKMAAVCTETINAMKAKHKVVFQAAFLDEEFQGFADFLILNEKGEYEVNDTKLARKAKITALLQLAAYADQLKKNHIPVGAQVHLLLGDGETSTHELSDIMPVFLQRRERMREVIAEREAAWAAQEDATAWNDPRYKACGKCPACDEQIQAHNDVLQVANLKLTQRLKLRAEGIKTLDDLATTSITCVAGIGDKTLATLKKQAQLQVATKAIPVEKDKVVVPVFEMHDPKILGRLPAPSEGDIFFDFEGDPLYEEEGKWNLDYLFGLVDTKSEFTPFWAHNFAQEKQALIEFIAFVKERRAKHPDMHIYHYAPYERAHLSSLSQRHGVGEIYVDQLIRDDVLIDLYPVVTRSMTIGSPSYSLKKLEPLYMESARNKKGVTNAADSVTEYAKYCELRDEGKTAEATALLKAIEDYNKYDCISTLKLHKWLLSEAAKLGVKPATIEETEAEKVDITPDPLYDNLVSKIAAERDQRSNDEVAVALTAAAIDYHRRENKSFWWDHFSRLSEPITDWQDTKDVCVVDSCSIVDDWSQLKEDSPWKRTLELSGVAGPGTTLATNDGVFLIYSEEAIELDPGKSPADRRTSEGTITEVLGDGHYVIVESRKNEEQIYDRVPLAIAPGRPPRTKGLVAAIKEVGEEILDSYPHFPSNAATDIVRRIAPRGPALIRPTSEDKVWEAISASLQAQENSYIAVQGPPGTGKTFTGSHVVADLVLNHGWKVGVVGQSHATVENMLRGIAKAGVPKEQVAKRPRSSDSVGAAKLRSSTTWTPKSSLQSFTDQAGGWVIGGTAWDFTSEKQVARHKLDLLVIDEAGQFSLANTLAVSVATHRLLLLGDPQQLPQVSQGIHPEPADHSALGWLANGNPVLPEAFGYFLEKSWRMNAAVCEVISDFAYDGKLASHAANRRLDGVAPGVYSVPLTHKENSTESVEEADAVVEIVRDLLSKTWHDEEKSGPLSEFDENIIVVAPYNAQVNLIRKKLDESGLTKIPVGTVDKFQGQEAAIAIVSLAASSAEDAPRGIDFLLSQNRLNVSISRAKWAAYIVYSEGLNNYLPHNVKDLGLLSQFINLNKA
jgi:predicted RecB family nuclease